MIASTSTQKYFLLNLFLLLFTITSFSYSQDSILTSRHYQTFSDDGAWCWFSDPRAIYVEGKTKQVIVGMVSKDGSIIASSYNTESKEKTEIVIHPNYNKDDHANPSFLVLPDKRIMIFYTSHGLPGNKIIYRTTKHPEDISEWDDPKNISNNIPGDYNFCYTNPVMLSAEKNRIYLFWRGGNFKPAFAYSDNLGQSWSKTQTLIQSVEYFLTRPYVKICTNNKDEIHFAFTDGHPRNEPLNSIYYIKYKNGKFFKADGTRIGDMNHLPIKHESADKVYDAVSNYKSTGSGSRAWIWDMALDKNGMPVIAYSRLPEETVHEYYYAKFDGNVWNNHFITNAGKYFPRAVTNKSQREREPHYSGGISLDHSNPSIVYLSKPGGDIFEIEKWITNDNGTSWSGRSITKNSLKDNVRPYVALNSPENISPRLFWMTGDYEHYTNFSTSIKSNLLSEKPSADLNKQSVFSAMKRVADWQIEEPLKYNLTDWTNGALFAGVVEWAKISGTEKYFDWLMEKGTQAKWNPGGRVYHADDHCIGQMYVEMFRKYNSKKMINPLINHFDWIEGNPSNVSLRFQWDSTNHCTDRWSWCDAIFMGPTVWTKLAVVTGKKKYLDFMEKEFRATTEYLYDKEEHLYFRDDRFFNQKEENGKKAFWGRGNGWVIAGLAIILKELPKDYPNKNYFENIYKEMAEKIASLQSKDGYWHASLLDPDSYPTPETSASSFYVYALASGINNGYLNSEKYLPVVQKGWRAIVRSVHPDGKLGWVQPIGESPKKVTAEMTEVYGVGAFLLAGTEMIKLVK
jgi:rhamnogalacturonyl hydrolase YesR